MFAHDGSFVNITNCSFVDNVAEKGYGGAILAGYGSTLHV